MADLTVPRLWRRGLPSRQRVPAGGLSALEESCELAAAQNFKGDDGELRAWGHCLI